MNNTSSVNNGQRATSNSQSADRDIPLSYRLYNLYVATVGDPDFGEANSKQEMRRLRNAFIAQAQDEGMCREQCRQLEDSLRFMESQLRKCSCGHQLCPRCLKMTHSAAEARDHLDEQSAVDEVVRQFVHDIDEHLHGKVGRVVHSVATSVRSAASNDGRLSRSVTRSVSRSARRTLSRSRSRFSSRAGPLSGSGKDVRTTLSRRRH